MNNKDKLSTVASSRSLPYKNQVTGSTNINDSKSLLVVDRQQVVNSRESKQQIERDQQSYKLSTHFGNSEHAGRQKELHLKIETLKTDGNSQRATQSQSTALAVETQIEKYHESESSANANAKTQGQPPGKEQTIDYKETTDNQNTTGSAFKTFSFVSVVMEPCKKNPKTMKARDRNKPIIEQSIINKQIKFMNKLQEYQKQNQSPLPIEFDEMRDLKINDSKKKKKSSDDVNKQIIRGNLGFCYLDMSLINLCGIPCLWIDPRELAIASAKITAGEKSSHYEPYIKPYQKNLLKKQFKIYTLLRFHKIFENDKYFGKNISMMFNQGCHNIIFDYWQFQTDNLKEMNTKYQQQMMKLLQKRQESFKESKTYSASVNEKKYALHIIQGSSDSIILNIPRLADADPCFFKLINSEAKLLKQILSSQNIQQTDQNNWNLLWTSTTLQQRPQIYEQLQDYQKINHFMNSVELTRKDRFADNILNLASKYGSNHFEFVPETFQYPDELPLFQQRFTQIKNKLKKQENNQDTDNDVAKEDNLWIYKPSQSSQGKGIYIIQELSDLQKDIDKGVLCRYISNPLLVNQHKFDLRIYVLVTSVDPLRIYVYNEGITRFASSPYENSKNTTKNLYSHLTNYSINKKSDSFAQNKSLEERDHGNKWSISDLQKHLEKLGINMQPIWERIYDAIIKSIISVEHHLLAGCKKIQHSSRPQNCFELFGFDVILDNNFKPYILEVNFSPSLSADSPLDYHIKSNLLVDTLNIVGLKKNYKRRTTSQKNPNLQKLRQNLNTNGGQAGYLQMIQAHLKTKESQRQNNNLRVDYNSFSHFLAQGNVDQYFLDRLSRISAKHRELVYETLDEMQRNKHMNFTCIYPAAGCYQYDRFFEGGGRQSNQLIHRYLFTKNELFTLTKQISDFQKQCIKTKYGEDYNSQSEENEDQQDQHSSQNHDSDEQEKEEKQKESILPSPQPRLTKLTTEPPTILEKNELSDSASNENIISQKNQQPPKIDSSEKKKEPLPTLKIEITQLKSETNNFETKENQSVESPTRIINNPQPSNMVSLESQSPTKITNFSLSNEIETPSKQELLGTINFKIDKKNVNIDDKLKTPVPHDNLPKIGIKTSMQINEYKSQIPSPNERNRDSSEPSFSYKHSMSKIVQNKAPKKEDTACNVSNSNKHDAETKKTRNSKVKDYQGQLTTNNTLTTLQPKEEKKVVKQEEEPAAKNVVKEPVDIEVKMQISATSPIKDVLNETIQDTMATIAIDKVAAVPDKAQTKEEKKENKPAEDSEEQNPEKKKKQKMIITGDDILIEYVNRIIKHLESICVVFQKRYNQKIEQVEDILPQQLKSTLERFAMHSIWSNKLNSVQKQSPLNSKIRVRHKEMVDRRTKILTSQLKKNNNKITSSEIQEELKTQDTNREKIISRIQSQKIEKMVKQSNVENQIDIVSILVEGSYNLPIFLQVSGGKTVINGTLSSLKIFEKILKSEKVQNLQNNFLLMEQEKKQFTQHQQQSPQKMKTNIEFLTETKPTRENSKLFVSSILVNSSNTQLAYRPHQLQSANKAEKYHLPMIIGGVQPAIPQPIVHEKQNLNNTLNNVFPEAQRRRMTNSGSASGYKHSQIKSSMMAPIENNSQTYNNSMVHTMVGINNTYIQTGSNNVDENRDALKYHSISEGPKPKISRQIMAVVHQKNTQSFMSSQNNTNYQGDPNDYQKQQSFDKRQRSYRNDNHMLSMTYNKNNQDQMMHLHKEIQDKIRVQNIQSNGLQRMNQNNYQNMQDPELNLNNIKNMSPDINFNKSAYINQTFSPQSTTGPNQKVSNSAISIVKAGEHLINNSNSSFIEFNRSHQGEGFFKKIHNIKKTDNYESIQNEVHGHMPGTLPSSVIGNGPLDQLGNDGKRGSSHSHQAGGGTRTTNFNTGGIYTNNIVHGKAEI